MTKQYGTTAPDANPVLVSTWLLEIDGVAITAFEKCKIGDSEWGQGDNRTGIDNLSRDTFSGIKNAETITVTKTLREGGAEDIKVFERWFQNGSTDRRNGAVALLARDGSEQIRYQFRNAWIQKIERPELDAVSENGKADFIMTLSCKEIEVA